MKYLVGVEVLGFNRTAKRSSWKEQSTSDVLWYCLFYAQESIFPCVFFVFSPLAACGMMI